MEVWRVGGGYQCSVSSVIYVLTYPLRELCIGDELFPWCLIQTLVQEFWSLRRMDISQKHALHFTMVPGVVMLWAPVSLVSSPYTTTISFLLDDSILNHIRQWVENHSFFRLPFVLLATLLFFLQEKTRNSRCILKRRTEAQKNDNSPGVQWKTGVPTACFFFFKIYFIEVQLIFNVVLISAVQQSDSVLHIYILFHILSHYGLSQDTEYSSLCYTVGPCCLSILYIIVCICQSQTPTPSLPTFLPLGNYSLFSMSVSLFLFCRSSFVSYFRFHI